MAAHNPEDSAGAQLAMLAALKYLLSAHRGNEAVAAGLEQTLEEMRAVLLASPAEERKITAFDSAAESLLHSLR